MSHPYWSMAHVSEWVETGTTNGLDRPMNELIRSSTPPPAPPPTPFSTPPTRKIHVAEKIGAAVNDNDGYWELGLLRGSAASTNVCPQVGTENWEEMHRNLQGVLGEESLPERGRDVMLTPVSPRKTLLRPLRQYDDGYVPSCGFCLNNLRVRLGPSFSEAMQGHLYKHATHDKRGRVVCAALKSHSCEGCGATGEMAHTLRYCPFSKHFLPHSPFKH